MTAEWYYERDRQRFGPVSASTLRELVATGGLDPDSLVWSPVGGIGPAPFRSSSLTTDAPAETLISPAPQGFNWQYVRNGSRFGPVSREELLQLADRGELDDATLVRDLNSGANFVRLGESGLRPGRGEARPEPARRVNDALVWIVVAIPLASALIEVLSGQDTGSTSVWWPLTLFAANSAVCHLDTRQLIRSGALSKKDPVGFWWWLVPVYLWKRQTAVRGPRAVFWAWIASFVASLVVADQADRIYLGTGLPACDSGYQVRETRKVFDKIALDRAIGQQADSLTGIREIGVAAEVRTCVATLTTTSGRTLRILYTVERNGDQLYTHLRAF